jgi:hypothetical protein
MFFTIRISSQNIFSSEQYPKNTMKISATTLTFMSVVGLTAGFAPNAATKTATSLSLSDIPMENAGYPEVNGWSADPSKFCAGLPGSVAPLGEFDPLGLVSKYGLSVDEIKRYRESEVTHGRVAMLASLGYLVGESFHPFFGGVVSGPANSHLAQVQDVAPGFFIALTVAIGASELYRAKTGWNAPPKVSSLVATSWLLILILLKCTSTTGTDSHFYKLLIVVSIHPGTQQDCR